jgi:lipopolysaccharide/colanic/teichoic acid biosynthesis glycosyltransferase
MELNLLQKQRIVVHDSLLHIQLDSRYSEKKKIIEESLRGKKIEIFLKRSFDIFASSLFILCLSPIFIITAVLIKLTSRGPILFSNERIGYRGKTFPCLKFRSMVADQSTRRSDYEVALAGAQKGLLHKSRNDTRITWIGKIIRKTSIDELPQLFNVLKGDMSIIGPRPLLPFMLKNLPEFKEIRSLVRPGITGLWQIRDRENNTSAEFMVEHDTEYVENYSFLLDMKILFKTPIVVITGDGAY